MEKVKYTRAAKGYGDHSIMTATQVLAASAKGGGDTTKMSAVYAMTGDYIAAARRLVLDSANEFTEAQDKNTAWDLLTTRLMDLYQQHVKDLRRPRAER